MSLTYQSVAALVQAAQEHQCLLSHLVLKDQAAQFEQAEEAIYERMRENYQVMCDAITTGTDANLRSTSGLTGGDAYKLYATREAGKSLTGTFMSGALYRALAVAELNAAMGRVVAAPTAGSCGILPAAIATMQSEYALREEACVNALFTASAIGLVIGNNASLAGASGGCQAECGSASAMAAAAIVELAGGTPEMIDHAVAIALKNVLGLVCDPVAGLVEIPCIKRNAGGVASAFMAAELALAGIPSYIPADDAILAMKQVGDALPATLRETAGGGLATTPTGQALNTKVFGDNITGSHCPHCPHA